MAINDYATLQQAIADHLARSDLTAIIPTFISLAEADFNRQLRTRFQQATVSGTITDDFTFPADFLEVVSFRVLDGGRQREIYPLTPASAADLANQAGIPTNYVVLNDDTGSSSGVGYVLTYLQSIPALSEMNTQNWLIQREPGLYLYQALTHASPYLKEDERAITWGTMARAIMDGMKREDDNARYGNSPAMKVGIHAP